LLACCLFFLFVEHAVVIVMSKPTLFVMRPSVTACTPWVLLKASGIEHEIKDVDLMKGEQMTPEFLAMNPMHTVPTLRDADGTTMWESQTILRYLCNKYPEQAGKFYPNDPAVRARIDNACDWRNSVFYDTIAKIAYPTLGFSPAADGIPAAQKKWDEVVVPVMLNYWLKDGRKFVCGDTVTIADISFATPLVFLEVNGEPLAKELVEYRERVAAALPGFNDVQNGDGGFGARAYVEMKKIKKDEKKE
jgi:glutathione S-transferase